MTSCRRSSSSSDRSQPGSLMKSEMTNTSDRRLIALWPASSSGARSVNGAAGVARLRSRASTMRRTWTRPLPAGIVRWTPSPYSTAPTRLPRRVSRRASVVTKSIRTVRLRRSASAVPKSTDGLRSSRNQAVSSRSSVYSRTYGASIRAVTFQSM